MPLKFNLTNQQFDFLFVIKHISHGYWLCRCICDNEKIIDGYHLRNRLVKSCGCKTNDLKSQNNAGTIDLIDKKIGRLLVLHKIRKNDKNGWLCECDCGNQCFQTTETLRKKKLVSCGCWYKEYMKKRSTIHDLSGTPEYLILLGIRQRCLNKNNIGI